MAVDNRTERVVFKVKKMELALIDAMAEKEGLTRSEWIRVTLFNKIRRG